MSRNVIESDASPTPAGPYSHGVVARGPLVFVAGQLPIDPGSGMLVEGDFDQQARAALRNLRTVVEASGAELDQVVRVGVFLRDPANGARLSAIYTEVFRAPYPARTTIGAALPMNAEIEVDAIIALG